MNESEAAYETLEILAYGVAIVVATDCRTDSTETTIFVVCDDEL